MRGKEKEFRKEKDTNTDSEDKILDGDAVELLLLVDVEGSLVIWPMAAAKTGGPKKMFASFFR